MRSPGSITQDLVPVVVSTSVMGLSAFPSLLQAVQMAGMWFPVDCAGVPCTYESSPSAIDVSVDYVGVGVTATGNSIARIGTATGTRNDWTAAATAPSWGLPNP